MNKDYIRNACKELIMDLCILVERNRNIDRDRFHKICQDDRFIDSLFIEFGDDILKGGFLDKTASICDKDGLRYIENAFGRMANACICEDFGLKTNPFLLAVNFAVMTIEETY